MTPWRFLRANRTRLKRVAESTDLLCMDLISTLAVLGGASLAGILILGVMASRIDNKQRFVDLVRDTRRLRASCHASVPSQRSRRRGG